MSAKLKKTINIVANVLIWIFVAFSLVITIIALSSAASSEGVPSVGGYCIMTVQSDSMEPVFYEGDLLIGHMIDDEDSAKLEVGTIISFYADLDGDNVKEINTHRITSVVKDGSTIKYTTKGDNEQYEDWYTTYADDVIATYEGEKLSGVGAVLDFLQSKTGFLVCVVIPMALFFAYELYRFIKTALEIKNEGKKQITAADEEEIKRKAIEEYLRQMGMTNATPVQTASSETNQENTGTPEQ